MNKFSLKGKTALISGGSRGCGFAFASGLAEAGADIAIFDIIPPCPEYDTLAKKYNVKTKHYLTDVSNNESLEKSFKQFVIDFDGKLDISVPCAGVNKNVKFLETSLEEFERLSTINFQGIFFTAQLSAKQMIKNGTKSGSIILIASMGSYRAIRTQYSSAYCGSKGAVRTMVPPIAAELAEYGIRVNSISPGYIKTEMTAPFPHLLKSWGNDIMLKRVANPDELKGTCVFLASEASSYLTGEDILVDGGVTKW